MHFQNIDFDIDIELFGNFDIDIGIDIEKNGENIENLSSEKNTSASLTLSFWLDFSFFSPLSFDIVSWVLGSSFPFFLRLSNLFIILGLIQNNFYGMLPYNTNSISGETCANVVFFLVYLSN